MRISNALQKVLDASRDGERMLRYESHYVDSGRRPVLTRLADDRRASIEQLRAAPVASKQSKLTSKSSSWFDLLRELGRTTRVAFGGRNSGDSVAACRRSMSRAEAVYDRAVALPWPEETLALLVEQRGSVRHASIELIAIQF